MNLLGNNGVDLSTVGVSGDLDVLAAAVGSLAAVSTVELVTDGNEGGVVRVVVSASSGVSVLPLRGKRELGQLLDRSRSERVMETKTYRSR
jgi:hypothetical protein